MCSFPEALEENGFCYKLHFGHEGQELLEYMASQPLQVKAIRFPDLLLHGFTYGEIRRVQSSAADQKRSAVAEFAGDGPEEFLRGKRSADLLSPGSCFVWVQPSRLSTAAGNGKSNLSVLV